MRPKHNQSYECWVDADFAVGFDCKITGNDPTTSKSRSGWVIAYTGCLVTWSSKLQTLMALSTMEAEYITLSTHALTPMMELTREMAEHYIESHKARPKIMCKIFEDNSGAVEMAHTPKLQLRTKHIKNAYHHFCEYTQPRKKGELPQINVVLASTMEQIGDMLTKPLPEKPFAKFHNKFIGW